MAFFIFFWWTTALMCSWVWHHIHDNLWMPHFCSLVTINVQVELGLWTMEFFILNKAAFSMKCPLQNTPAATPFEYEEWKQRVLSWSTTIYSHNWGLFQKKSAQEAWTVMETSSQGTSLGTLKSLHKLYEQIADFIVIRQRKLNICPRWGPVWIWPMWWVRAWHCFGLLH